MGNNLTNEYISSSFQQLVQVSSSLAGQQLTDGTGSLLQSIDIQAATAISSSYAVTASYAENGGGGSVDTGSLLVTSSAVNDTITFTKGDGSTYTNVLNNISHSLTTDEVVVNVKNTSGTNLAIGTPVYATGVTGENINIASASNASSTTMPAIGVLGAALSNNATGTAVVSGKIVGVNTAGFTAGRNIYVNANGDYTQTKPTGSALIQNIGVVGKVNVSAGEILIQGAGRTNDLPNIASGYIWAGNGDSVPTAVISSSLLVDNAVSASHAISSSHAINADNSISSSYATSALSSSYSNTSTSASHAIAADTSISSSHAIDADKLGGIAASTYARTDVNNTFTGLQTFDNITVNGTGSFAYLQSVTGSAKIIGDAFIILNNDTPTQRYAGIMVQDSGSSNNTASLQWDGATDDWFFEKDVSGVTEFGVFLGGPEYTTKGSPVYNAANTIVKGTGGHHLDDSNITDNGSVVNINSNTKITGSLIVSQSGLSSGEDVFVLGAPRDGGNSLEGVIRSTVDDGLTFYGNKFFNTGANYFSGGSTSFESGPVEIGNPSNAVNLKFYNNSQIDVDGTTLPILGDVQVQGNLNVSGSGGVGGDVVISDGANGATLTVSGTTGGRKTLIKPQEVTITADSTGSLYLSGNYGTYMSLYSSADDYEIAFTLDADSYGAGWTNGAGIINNAAPGNTYDTVIGFQNKTNYTNNAVTILTPFVTDSDVDLLGYNNFVHGKLGGRKFYTSNGTKTAQDIIDNSYTASVDSDSGNLYELHLPASADTRIEITTEVGQSVQYVIINSGASTVTWPAEYVWPGGTAPTLTSTSGSIDVVSAVRYSNDVNTVVATSAADFS